MPFTFAHPAIILPLTRTKYTSASALVIGSIIPDFEYFFRLRIESKFSHTIMGMFYFDLPITIICCFIFHLVVRDKIRSNLPKPIAERLNGIPIVDWLNTFKKNWLIIIVSALLGISSHLLWDSFTHEHGYFVERISALHNNLFIGNINIPVYKLIQHSSTLVGFAVIVCVIYMMPRTKKIDVKSNAGFWPTVLFTVIILISIRLVVNPTSNMGNILVTVIAGVLLGVCIASFKTINHVNFKKSCCK